jgi:hypothetical protein
MSQIPLRPAAGLINTFAPAEVRGTTDGSQLVQLSSALSEFNPALQSFSTGIARRMDAEGQSQAAATFAQRQFKNMTELRSAVEKGEIDESANPYSMVYLKQLVAKRMAGDTATALESEYYAQGIDKKNDPAEVSAWWNERVSKIATDLDDNEAGIFGVEIERSRERLLDQHVRIRSVENRQERQDSFAQTFVRDLERGDVVNAQTQINAARLVLPAAAVREIVVRSAVRYAAAQDDTTTLDEALAGITVDGKSVLSSMSETEREEIDLAIGRQIDESKDRKRQAEAEANTEAINAVLSMDPNSPITREAVNALPNAKDRLYVLQIHKALTEIDAVEEVDARGPIFDAAATSLAGSITNPEIKKQATLLLATVNGVDAFTTMKELKALDNQLAADGWGEAGVEDRIQITEKYFDTKVSDSEYASFLFQLARDKKISQAQFNDATRDLNYRKSGENRYASEMLDEMLGLGGQSLTATLLSSVTNNPDLTDPATGEPLASVELDASTLSRRLRVDVREWMVSEENRKTGRPGLEAFLTQRINTLTTEFNRKYGITGGSPAPAAASPAAGGTTPSPVQPPKAVSTVDDLQQLRDSGLAPEEKQKMVFDAAKKDKVPVVIREADLIQTYGVDWATNQKARVDELFQRTGKNKGLGTEDTPPANHFHKIAQVYRFSESDADIESSLSEYYAAIAEERDAVLANEPGLGTKIVVQGANAVNAIGAALLGSNVGPGARVKRDPDLQAAAARSPLRLVTPRVVSDDDIARMRGIEDNLVEHITGRIGPGRSVQVFPPNTHPDLKTELGRVRTIIRVMQENKKKYDSRNPSNSTGR